MAVKYVAYYDCSDWQNTTWESRIEIMNIVDQSGRCRIEIYDRNGGTPLHTSVRTLNAYETLRVHLNPLVANGTHKEGLVMVMSEDPPPREFPTTLVIRSDSQTPPTGNRYVPFTRVPRA